MKIKTTLRFHLNPVQMAKITKTTDNKCWRHDGGEGERDPHLLLVELETGATVQINVKNSQKAKAKSTI